MQTHHGMRIRRLPTIRSKHLETFIHTLLSTGACHDVGTAILSITTAWGPRCFLFFLGWRARKTVSGAGAGLAARQMGAELRRGCCGGEKRPPYRLPDATMVVSANPASQYYILSLPASNHVRVRARLH